MAWARKWVWLVWLCLPACVEDERGPAGGGEGVGSTDTGNEGGEGTGDGDSDCEGVIFNDDDCADPRRICASPSEIRPVRYRDCYEKYVNYCYCSAPICDGWEAPEPCPVDMVCIETDEQNVGAQCLPQSQACGGPTGQLCPDGTYCHERFDLCTDCTTNPNGCGEDPDRPWGLCAPQPDPDTCPADGNAVCGCDGVVYANACAAAAAGMSLRALVHCD